MKQSMGGSNTNPKDGEIGSSICNDLRVLYDRQEASLFVVAKDLAGSGVMTQDARPCH
jgi:hypothetical protein